MHKDQSNLDKKHSISRGRGKTLLTTQLYKLGLRFVPGASFRDMDTRRESYKVERHKYFEMVTTSGNKVGDFW